MEKYVLQTLICARDLLDKTFIKWMTDDGAGGHCQYGCILKCSTVWSLTRACEKIIDDTAREMFPELEGKEEERNFAGAYDEFSVTPGVYVNNHLGKEAILRVYDKAIANLEAAKEL